MGGGWWVGMGLVLLCLSVYLPGLWSIPPVDRDESRFAQASRQMYESGDWVVPRIQDRPRLNKPPLIYWCQCASIAVFGDRPGQYAHGNIWVFRVPSVLAAIGSVLLTWRIGLRLMAAPGAALGAALLAVSPMIVWDAHQARADQLLLFCTTAAMLALLSSRERSEGSAPSPAIDRSVRSRLVIPALFWLALAAGILTKGPITPMIVGLTALALSLSTRQWRWLLDLRPVLGLLILAAMIGPWLFAVGTHVGWSEYLRVIVDETLGRSAVAKEGHWGPPGYHLVLLTVLMWPGSLLTGWALLRRKLVMGDSRFLLCWIIPSWLVFELVSTKLPHYTMPLYPALALLSARAVFAASASTIRDLGTRIGFAIWWLVGLAATLGLSALVAITGVLGSPSQREGAGGRVWFSFDALSHLAPYTLPALLILVFLLAAGRSLIRGAYLRAQFQSMIAVVIWGATFLQFILPGAQRFWISPRVLALGDGFWQNASDFQEDSLVFLARGRVGVYTDEQVLSLFGNSDTLFIHGPFLLNPTSAVLNDPGTRPWTASIIATITGWNYSNGREATIIVAEPVRTRKDEPR